MPRSSRRRRSAIAARGPPRFGTRAAAVAADARDARPALRGLPARDEPRRQAVAGGALARADRVTSRARASRSLLPWGEPDERARSRAPRRGMRRRERPAAAGAARNGGARSRAPSSSSASTRASCISPRRSGTPTIALFIATDAALAGVERASARARDLGGIGSRARRVDEVDATRAAARCARARAALLMRALYTLLVVSGAAVAAAAAVVARPTRARAIASTSASASAATAATSAPQPRVLWVHAVSLGETRAAAPLVDRMRSDAIRRRRSSSRT